MIIKLPELDDGIALFISLNAIFYWESESWNFFAHSICKSLIICIYTTWCSYNPIQWLLQKVGSVSDLLASMKLLCMRIWPDESTSIDNLRLDIALRMLKSPHFNAKMNSLKEVWNLTLCLLNLNVSTLLWILISWYCCKISLWYDLFVKQCCKCISTQHYTHLSVCFTP